MFNLSYILSNVDAIVSNNTISAIYDNNYYNVKISDKINDGVIFFSRNKMNWSKSSITELINKSITPVDTFKLKIIDEKMYTIDIINLDIFTLKKAMIDKGIYRYDKYATLKDGYFHIFHPNGVIKIKSRSNKNIKIKSILLLNMTGYINIIENKNFIGIEIIDSVYSVKIYHKKTKEKSLIADEIIDKTKGEYESTGTKTFYNQNPFKQSVNKKGTIKEVYKSIELYTTGII